MSKNKLIFNIETFDSSGNQINFNPGNYAINNTNKTEFLNNRNYLFYFDMIKNALMSSYDILGLPLSCNKWCYKQQMFEGLGVIFNDDDMNEIVNMWVSPTKKLMWNGDPEEITARSVFNGYEKKLEYKDCAIIWDNNLHKSMADVINMYAIRLANMDRIIDINVNAQKTPLLLLIKDEKLKVTIKNMYEQYIGNMPAIWGEKNVPEDFLKVLKTDAPFIAPALHDLRVRILGEVLSYCGIDNVAYEKRAQMSNDEIEMSTGLQKLTLSSRIQTQQDCWDRANAKFGLNVKIVANRENVNELKNMDLNELLDEHDENRPSTEEGSDDE